MTDPAAEEYLCERASEWNLRADESCMLMFGGSAWCS
jgi:hypothetical protein